MSTTSCEFWDKEIVEQSHSNWMAHLEVRFYINRSISGEKGGWPLDWLQKTFPDRRFARALSVGCGTGPLERDLIRRGICDHIDAFDGSVHSLYRARTEAKSERMDERLQYFAWDFNEPHMPRNTYDAVFFHQSLHHVAKLEKLLRAVLLSMKPGALLYLDEMLGLSRSDWNDQTVAPFRAIYRSVPRQHRTVDELPLPIQPDDPSEAFRSGEILEQLRIGFDITHFRGYGGNVLAVFFPMLRNISDELIRDLISKEKEMLAQGNQPFYAVIAARPKRGLLRWLASARYFLEPELKRMGRESRQLTARAARTG